MNILTLSRYLCLLLTLAFVLVSGTTYAPAAARTGEAFMWSLAFLSFLSAGFSLFLSAQRTRHPDSKLLRSRALHFSLMALAILLTLLLLLGVAG